MKNLTALLVVAVLVTLLLTGCKATDNPAPTNAPDTTAQAVNEPEAVTPETTVENKQEADVKPAENAVKPTNPPAQEVKVSKDEVKKTVLNHAGLAETEVNRYKAELDKERGGLVYDVEFDEELEYKIVGSTEANSLKGKISNESPVGKALMGKQVGETVVVETQSGAFSYKILEIQRSN